MLFLPLTWYFGCHNPELASTLLKKQFLTKEQDFPEDCIPYVRIVSIWNAISPTSKLRTFAPIATVHF